MGHFLLPFILAALSGVHLLFLHQTGSSNPLGVNRNLDKSPFHPYFSLKDTFGFLTFMALLLSISFIHPWDLGDPKKFYPRKPYGHACSYPAGVIFFIRVCHPSLYPQKTRRGCGPCALSNYPGCYTVLRCQKI